MTAPRNLLIEGEVSAGLEPVCKAFIENFTRRGELGAACCIYQHGERSSISGAACATARAACRGGFYVGANLKVVRNLEVPSGGGVGSARAIARAYGAFASGGREVGLRADTIEALMAPAIPSQHGFLDERLRGPAQFSLGFMKPNESFRFGHDGAFGAPGAGGAMGYADPVIGVGYGYVTNRMGMNLQGDPRDVALRDAFA